jgi:hypothetical protein
MSDNQDMADAITRDPETMHGVPDGSPRAGLGSIGRGQAALAGLRLMRLSIDECVDERLRLVFPGHDCQTARFAGLAGLKNGALLDAAEAAGGASVERSGATEVSRAAREVSLVP